MRSTTAAKEEASASADPVHPAASRRNRAKPDPAPIPEHASADEPAGLAVTAVRMLQLDEGLYALRVGPIEGKAGEVSGLKLPIAQLSIPFAGDGNGVEIVASFPRRGPWLEREGGTAVVRSPVGGGYLILTVYAEAGESAAAPAFDLQRLDGPPGRVSGAAEAASETAEAAAEPRDVAIEVLLHIERAGDRLFPGRGWVGALGRKLRIEAFSIRPLERLSPADIEFKGFLPNGAETQWVHGGILCGTRGRRLPLTGFAVRLAPQLAGRFEVSYQGSFFASGISGVHRNGEPCRAPNGDEPLEAINIRLVERGTATEQQGQEVEP